MVRPAERVQIYVQMNLHVLSMLQHILGFLAAQRIMITVIFQQRLGSVNWALKILVDKEILPIVHAISLNLTAG
jgi:hypothetical protein